MAAHTLVSGTGPASLRAMIAAEAGQPEGEQLEWRVQVQPRLPVLGTNVQVPIPGADSFARALALALNWAHDHLPGLKGVHLWPGTPFAEAQGAYVRVRWVKAATASSEIIAFISAAVPAGVIAYLAGANVPGLILTALTVGFLFADLVYLWNLIAYGVSHATAIGQGLLLAGAGVAVAAVGLVYLLNHLGTA